MERWTARHAGAHNSTTPLVSPALQGALQPLDDRLLHLTRGHKSFCAQAARCRVSAAAAGPPAQARPALSRAALQPRSIPLPLVSPGQPFWCSTCLALIAPRCSLESRLEPPVGAPVQALKRHANSLHDRLSELHARFAAQQVGAAKRARGAPRDRGM